MLTIIALIIAGLIFFGIVADVKAGKKRTARELAAKRRKSKYYKGSKPAMVEEPSITPSVGLNTVPVLAAMALTDFEEMSQMDMGSCFENSVDTGISMGMLESTMDNTSSDVFETMADIDSVSEIGCFEGIITNDISLDASSFGDSLGLSDGFGSDFGSDF